MATTSNSTKKKGNRLFTLFLIGAFSLLLSGCTFNLDTLFESKNSQLQEKYVKGLPGIPRFPDSEFLFKTNESSQEVKEMLADQDTAYRLTNDSSFEDAVEFYKEELKKLDWQFSHEVKLDSKTQKYGYYWTKADRGLRIYEQINDIWYQSLTAEEAKAGLSYLVALESKEYYNPQNLVKLSSLVQTSWDFEFPDSWQVTQRNSTYSKGLDLVFKYSLGGFELRIQDLGKELGTDLEHVWLAYLDKLNAGRDEDEKYELLVEQLVTDVPEDVSEETTTPASDGQTPVKSNPQQLKLSGLDAMELTLVKKDTNAKAYITFVKHPTNARFYAIVNVIGDKEFYDYIKMTIKPI